MAQGFRPEIVFFLEACGPLGLPDLSRMPGEVEQAVLPPMGSADVAASLSSAPKTSSTKPAAPAAARASS